MGKNTPNDVRLMRDIDMSSFAKDYEHVLRNGRDIYKEAKYVDVDDKAFEDGRYSFLSTIANPKISLYLSDYFQTNYESKAKRNIKRELIDLETYSLDMY